MLLGQHRHRWGTREWVPIDSSSEPEVTIYISMEYTDSSNFQHAFASVYLYLKYRYSMTSKKQRRLCPWKEWKQHSCNKQQWRVKRFEEVSQIVTTCRNFKVRKVSEAFSSNFPVMVGSWISLVWPSLKPSFSSDAWHNLTQLDTSLEESCSNGSNMFQLPSAFSTIFLKVSHSYAIRLSFRFCRLPNGRLKWYKWWLLTVDNIWTLSKKNSWPSALRSLRYLDTSSTEQDLTLSDTKKDSFQRRFSAAELLTKRFRLDPDGDCPCQAPKALVSPNVKRSICRAINQTQQCTNVHNVM